MTKKLSTCDLGLSVSPWVLDIDCWHSSQCFQSVLECMLLDAALDVSCSVWEQLLENLEQVTALLGSGLCDCCLCMFQGLCYLERTPGAAASGVYDPIFGAYLSLDFGVRCRTSHHV